MSSLTHIEKQKLERALGMSSGYVLNFSNRSFEEFFREVVKVNIYDQRFDRNSGSKANRTRAFWDISSDTEVTRFLDGLIEAWDIYSEMPISESTSLLFDSILKRLKGTPVAKTPTQVEKDRKIDSTVSSSLLQKLIDLNTLSPQTRGFEFERFLKALFEVNGLSPKASFRLVGEQIDGSFLIGNETYLLEAKWQNAPIGASDLHTFEGKLGEKASWSRGLFVSISGFSQDGLTAFGRGKRVVCMDGFDLSEVLRLNLSFEATVAAKVRRAAETGKPYVPVRELNL